MHIVLLTIKTELQTYLIKLLIDKKTQKDYRYDKIIIKECYMYDRVVPLC